MNVEELLGLFRSEMNDLAEPFLWGEEELVGYIDDAQKMFCRLTDGIGDDETPEVVELAVSPGTDRLSLHKTIRRVRSATRLDTGHPVEVLNNDDLRARGLRFDGRAGPVLALVLSDTPHRARVWPLSNETVTLGLSVFRLPLAAITDTDQDFEVDEEHHPHLLHWVKHRAYLKQDAETLDKTKSQEFEVRFRAYCAEVQAEETRKRHKTRVVRYGGI